MSFLEIADARGMTAAMTELGELAWDVPVDAALAAPVPDDVAGILGAMARRGLDPVLVERLLDRWPARPIDRAIIAWDVAKRCLFGRADEVFARRIELELAPLRAIGPTREAAVPVECVPALREAVRPTGDLAAVLDGVLDDPSLAAIVGLTAIRNATDLEPAFVEAFGRQIERLQRAHLPALAQTHRALLALCFGIVHPMAADERLGLEDHIARFGNDQIVWGHAALDGVVPRVVAIRILSREVQHVSHDPEVWRGLAWFVANGDAIRAEVDRRTLAQLDAVLASTAVPAVVAPPPSPGEAELERLVGTGQWREAVAHLQTLAEAESDAAARARYHVQAGAILRDQLGDVDAAVEQLQTALDCAFTGTPTGEELAVAMQPFDALVAMLAAPAHGRTLERSYRKMIRRLSSTVHAKLQATLFERLAEIYRAQGQHGSAVASLEMAQQLDPGVDRSALLAELTAKTL